MPLTKHISKFLFSIILLFLVSSVYSQISHGGRPLPLNVGSKVRVATSTAIPFVEMPAVNNMELLRNAEVESSKFKSLEFAHKFHVFLRPDNSGISFTTSDNINVWRVGIRSKNALSLNILFSKFHLPEGAKVFVYNADQSEILGSYTHKNNTELNLLPVQPIAGDEIIVEYQEPADAAFKGEIEIGEVNHDFRGIFRATEPRDPEQSCHPNLVCYPEDIEAGSGVVGLIINGSVYCTGSLVNNTAQDGTPYLLTATHCLNSNFRSSFLANRQYQMVAGNIVAFFHYHSPVCSKDIRGPLQMSLASADSVLVLESYDISLLKFKDMPPAEYQPKYLGWNLSSSPDGEFHGLHHPNGGIKKVAIEKDKLGGFATFSFTNQWGNTITFANGAHIAINAWDVGATEGGSSGSPLFDKDKHIIGSLTGGESYCSSPKGPDIYASLHKAWTAVDTLSNFTLKDFLDPINSSATKLSTFNPYVGQPYVKNANYAIADTIVQSLHNSVPLFATNNTLGYNEFAEEFFSSSPTKLRGVFVSSSVTNSISNVKITIKVYGDNNGSPGALLQEVPLNYSYRYNQGGNFHETNRNMRHNVENYVRFSTPIDVSGKFFISYTDANNTPNGFSLLNVQPRKRGSGAPSTAWLKDASGWIKSTGIIENPINTSLTIAPYTIGTGLSPVDPEKEEPEITAYYNKAEDRIFIESNKEFISWEIFYVSGQKVFEGKAESSINRTSFPFGHLAKGVYIVKVKVEGKEENKKVLVR